MTLCRRCRHTLEAHQHLRKGTECVACDTCGRYRRWWIGGRR